MTPAATAAAIATDLNLGAFSLEFTAVRAYRPVLELTELKTLHVTVVPKATARELLGRDQSEHETQIDIAVQQRVDPDDLTECDGLDSLCDEIAAWYGERKSDLGTLLCTTVKREPIYDPEHLSQQRVFTGVITITLTHFS